MVIPIVSESVWRDRLADLPIWKPARERTIVVAPHPDDETLGAGGLIVSLRSMDIEVIVVAVTDGENAYPGDSGLGKLREQEQTVALGRLGVDSKHVFRLKLPDSGVSEHEPQLMESLLSLVDPRSQVIAPWRGDFHPDHEACGRAAEAVAIRKRATLMSYFFWTWHRGSTEILADLPLMSLPLDDVERRAKHEALLCHRSQLDHKSGDPILPENLLEPAWRPFEVFLPS